MSNLNQMMTEVYALIELIFERNKEFQLEAEFFKEAILSRIKSIAYSVQLVPDAASIEQYKNDILEYCKQRRKQSEEVREALPDRCDPIEFQVLASMLDSGRFRRMEDFLKSLEAGLMRYGSLSKKQRLAVRNILVRNDDFKEQLISEYPEVSEVFDL